MATDNLYPSIQNLDEYDIFLEEELHNSNYIVIDKLPNTIGYGKHYFLLSWKNNSNSEYQIKNGSKILFEFKDRSGNIIFSELSNTLPVNGAAVCYVWVKKNPLRLIGDRWEITDGICNLSVVYELEGGDINHNELAYGRSTFEYEIKKKISNISPILFHSGSQLSGGLSISESLDLDGDVASPYKRSYLHISNSFMKTDGGKVEFMELSYIENNSAASGSEFKLLTTYKLSASGDFFEVPVSSVDGLNPLSHIHQVVTPREIRRNRNVTFKLRFLNSNKDVAKDISENSDIELTHTMHVSGSPLIIEGQDNLIHTSASLGFGDNIEKSIRLQLTKDAEDSPRLSFKEFTGNVEVKEVGRIDAGKEQYTFGDLSSNDIEGNSSGSSIFGGFHNLITGSKNSSIIGSTGSRIVSSSISSILGGKNHKISLPITPTISNLSMNLMIGGNTNAITGSTIQSPTDNVVLGGSSNQISVGTFNTIIGGAGNKILSQSTSESAAGAGHVFADQHNLILGSTFGFIRYGTLHSSILASNGTGNNNFIGNPDTKVESSAMIACGVGNEIKHGNSVILGMANKTTTATNTVYVQNLFTDGNLSVSGTITAQEFHTEVTSASIIYESGSTKFGDTMDDIHNITGSVYTTGSLTINTELSASGAELTVQGDISASGYFYSDTQTQIKIKPSDFIGNDDAIVSTVMVEDDGSNFGIRASNSNTELYAYIDVPIGYTATKVLIKGSDTANDVEVYTYDMDDGTITSEISNTGLDVGDDLALATNHVGANDKLLLIKVVVTATSDLIYGGYITIEPS